jgi:arginine exporter protein ArgO
MALSPTLILIIIGVLVVYAFWRTIFKVVLVALIVGYVFLLVTGTLDVVHALRSLLP